AGFYERGTKRKRRLALCRRSCQRACGDDIAWREHSAIATGASAVALGYRLGERITAWDTTSPQSELGCPAPVCSLCVASAASGCGHNCGQGHQLSLSCLVVLPSR